MGHSMRKRCLVRCALPSQGSCASPFTNDDHKRRGRSRTSEMRRYLPAREAEIHTQHSSHRIRYRRVCIFNRHDQQFVPRACHARVGARHASCTAGTQRQSRPGGLSVMQRLEKEQEGANDLT